MKRVLIAGAGIIGLSTALELRLRGVEVTVLERGTAMREASWAAAGMLAAEDPENPPALHPLSHLSVSLYPLFLRRVEALSGHSVPLRTRQTLQVCRPGHTPPDAVLLSRAEAGQLVPGLSADVAGNFLLLQEASLDPRDLCRALPVAVHAAGVEIIEDCALESIAPEMLNAADDLVLCCGAWSIQNWLNPQDSVSDKAWFCVPRKGQMLAVRMPQGTQAPALETVLRSADVYLVPRTIASAPSPADANRIIIGATVENAGFDRTPHAGATAWLMEQAAALWPPIRHAQVEEVWTGIRPGTHDGLPFIGRVAAGPMDHLRTWVATGHYRNGIMLAPGTAHIIAESILLNEPHTPSVDMVPFRVSRRSSGEAMEGEAMEGRTMASRREALA